MRRMLAATAVATALLGFAAGQAGAVHITLEATGQGTTSSPVQAVITRGSSPAIVTLDDPLILFGQVTDDTRSGASFVHEYSFGFDTAGPAGPSVTPNLLELVGGVVLAGFAEFEGLVFGPNLPSGGLALTREEPITSPRLRRIFADFDALDTAGDSNPTPYTLRVFGRLLAGVTVGNYSGNVGVVPLPAAGLLFLTALGSFALLRRYRRSSASTATATATA